MKKEISTHRLEVWGGIECSISRVGDNYMDQAALSGHYDRSDDIGRFADLGIKAIRYPVLWERHVSTPDGKIDWSVTKRNLENIRANKIIPIAGLVHHGSGPRFVSFYDDSFANGLAVYAAQVAKKFPWLSYYTPVNEPLTTARFCGLYGHWFPHGSSNARFLQILLAETKATILAMQAVRKVNAEAKLVFTEDLGKVHGTRALCDQVTFENQRRWLSIDLICGKVNAGHPLYSYLLNAGIEEPELQFFEQNAFPPDVLGFNHYITSERFIDEEKEKYPPHTWGGNDCQQYADVEAVRVRGVSMDGPARLLKDAWQRYQLPLAVTEVHLHCTREEQLRWFQDTWQSANELKQEGVDIRAVTAWALLGSFDWCSLLTRPCGVYEPGVFDLRGGIPRPTALSGLLKVLSAGETFQHPLLNQPGWWKRPCRIQYPCNETNRWHLPQAKKTPLVIITADTGLGKTLARICMLRGIPFRLLNGQDFDLSSSADISKVIETYRPWAIINTAAFIGTDESANSAPDFLSVNTQAPYEMPAQCMHHGVKFIDLSSITAFNGNIHDLHVESEQLSQPDIFRQSKALAEQSVLMDNPAALTIKIGKSFDLWDNNFIDNHLNSFQNSIPLTLASDFAVSTADVTVLVNTSLDLLIDDEFGIWTLYNQAQLSKLILTEQVA